MSRLFKTLFLIGFISIAFQNCRKDDVTNAPPVIENQSFTVAEDVSSQDVIGLVAAEDANKKDALSFTVKTDESGLFEITSDGEISLITNSSLDFESQTTHTLVITVSDGKADDSAVVTIEVTDVNEPPSSANQQFTAPEDISDVTVIGTITGEDMDSESTLTYSISEDLSELFEVNATSGELSLIAGMNLNFEDQEMHTIEIEISDGSLAGLTTVEVVVEDINEPPVIVDQTISSPENRVNIGTVNASDPDASSTLSYSLLTNPGSLFSINQTTGAISTSDEPLNFENQTTHSISVQVSDGEFEKTATVTINVTDENDAPTLEEEAFSASEDLDDVTVIGTIVASDEDGTTSFTYSISVNDNDLFEIGAQSGEISLKADAYLDYEQHQNHTIEVTVSDGSATGTGSVMIDVTNIVDVNITDFAYVYANSLAIDASGNIYYASGHSIGQIDPSGNATLIAGSEGTSGSTDGVGPNARFKNPQHMVIDQSGNIYVAEQGNHTIRKIDPSGNVTTMAGISGTSGSTDGPTSTALLSNPTGVAFGSTDELYISEGNHTIRKLDLNANTLSTFAGTSGNYGYTDATGAAAQFNYAIDILSDGSGNLLVLDFGNHALRLINQSSVVSTYAGGTSGSNDGLGTAASFLYPRGFARSGTDIYVADSNNHTIRKVDNSGNVTTLVGKAGEPGDINGQGDIIRLNSPWDVCVNSAGAVFVSDYTNGKIKKIVVE